MDYKRKLKTSTIITAAIKTPLKASFLLSLTYLVISITYIFISDRIAMEMSKSGAQYQKIEDIKGTLFVILTSILIFGIGYWTLRKITQLSASLANQANILINSESRLTATTFASSIAHDLRNTITYTKGYLDILKQRDTTVQNKDIINKIGKGMIELIGMSEQLSTLSKTPTHGAAEIIYLADTITKSLTMAQSHPEIENCTIKTNLEYQAIIKADKILLMRMFTNLLLNAAQAITDKGQIGIDLTMDNENVYLEVSDSGPGIPENQRQLIFHPFYSTKGEAGTGLGLVSVQAFIEEYNGSVIIQKSKLGGACFKITIPRYKENNDTFIESKPKKKPSKPAPLLNKAG